MDGNHGSADGEGSSAPTGVTRRRALLGTAGVATAGLAGCLGFGASGSSNGADSDLPCFDSDGDTSANQPLSAPVKGDPRSDVTVVAYEDFGCPHCKEYVENVEPEIQKNYTKPKEIRYVHRDFPIPVTDQSVPAANAARAAQVLAGDKAFWVYLEQLFENQDSLGPDFYASLGDETCLGKKAIKNAAANQSYQKTVLSDRQHGLDEGVSATPTVFVNGSKVTQSYDAISSAIDAAK